MIYNLSFIEIIIHKKLFLYLLLLIYNSILIIIFIYLIKFINCKLVIKEAICQKNRFIKDKKDSNKINTKDNIFTNINYIALFIFKILIVINLYNEIKNEKFDFYNLQNSKISLIIKGVGENYILNGRGNVIFNNFNNLKEVYIN